MPSYEVSLWLSTETRTVEAGDEESAYAAAVEELCTNPEWIFAASCEVREVAS